MVWVDMDDEFIYKPQSKPATPPAAPVTPKPPPVYDYEYDTWRDGDRIWDRDSGLWFTPGPAPSVYNEATGGDQSVEQFNDYHKVLSEFAGFANNPIVSTPSAFKPQPPPQKVGNADWFNYDTYASNVRNDNPRAAFLDYDLGADAAYKASPAYKQQQYSEGMANIPQGEQPYELVNGQKQYGAPIAGSPSRIPISMLFGKANTGLDALAETTRDLTEPILRQAPIANLGFAATDALGITKKPSFKSQVTGGGTVSNLLNPGSFFSEQQNDLQKRGAADQLITQLGFDPTNAIGAGIGSKALKAGIKGSGLLSDLARAAAMADKAIDVGTAKVVGGTLKYGGRELAGAGIGAVGNEIVGGEDTTGLKPWQAAALGALGGTTTRKNHPASQLLAKAQGRPGLAPALGGQVDWDPEVTAIRDALKEARARNDVPRIQQLKINLGQMGARDTGFPSRLELEQDLPLLKKQLDEFEGGYSFNENTSEIEITDPDLKRLTDEWNQARLRINDYDRLKALHQASFEPESLGPGLSEGRATKPELLAPLQAERRELYKQLDAAPYAGRSDIQDQIDAMDLKIKEILASPDVTAGTIGSRSMEENIALQKENIWSSLSDRELIGEIKRKTADVENTRGIIANNPDYFKVSRALIDLHSEAKRRGLDVASMIVNGEGGSASAKVAARTGLAAGAGATGYLTADEDASEQERWLRALGFAGTAALGPEAFRVANKGLDVTASLGAKAGTKALGIPAQIPGLNTIVGRDRALGHIGWLEDAPIAKPLQDNPELASILRLKDDLGSGLPLRSKISNGFWKLLSAADKGAFATHVQQGDVARIAVMAKTNMEKIPAIVDTWEMEYKPLFDMFPADENGLILLDGKYVPALSKEGLPVMGKDGTPDMAGLADLMRSKEWYLENQFITPAQYDALNEIQGSLSKFPELQRAFGLDPDPDMRIDPANGSYFPFGRPVSQAMDKTPSLPPPGKKIGVEPGANKDRFYDSIGQGVKDGKRYPQPLDTAKTYISELLQQVNAENASRNLKKLAFEVELKTGKETISLGQLFPDKTKKEALEAQVKANREIRKEISELKRRKTRIDRDIRLGSRWVNTNRNRVETLIKTLADQAISADARANVANEMLTITKQAINDASSAARDYVKKTIPAAVKDAEARSALNNVLVEAKRVSDEMNKLEDQIRAGELADLQQKFTSGWNFADGIRMAVAQDAAALDRVMSELAGRYEGTAANAGEAWEALQKVKGQFSEEFKVMKNLQKEAIDESARAARATEQVKQILSGGSTKPLQRIIEQKAESIKSVLAPQSEELATQIDWLKQMLAPNMANTKALQQDIAITTKLAKEVSQTYNKKIAGGGWGLAGWENIPLPAEIANTWRKFVPAESGIKVPGVQIYDFVNNALRMMGATADLSRTFTVGLLGGVDNPELAAKGFKVGVDTVKNGPEAAATAMREIQERGLAETGISLTDAVAHDLQLTTAEQFHKTFADEDAWAGKLTKAPLIKQADIMYTVPANVERAQRFYDTLVAWKLAGKDYTSDKALSIAANAANTLTGRAGRGLGSFAIGERGASRLFFAARFVQSQLETVANAMLVQGVEGEQARKALLKLALGGTALTFAINKANGNPTEYELFKDGRLNSNWMRVRVMDQDLSLFGPWDSLVKGLMATAQNDPYYFVRSKLGPVPGMAGDMFAGTNAIGQDIPKDPTSSEFWSGDNLLRRAPVPFGVRNIVTAAGDTDFTDPKSIANFGLSAAAGITGFKSAPLTEKEQYEREAAGAYDGYQPKVAYPHPSDPSDDPLFMAEYAAKNPGKVPQPSSSLGKELKTTRDPIVERQQANHKKFVEGGRNLGDWKEARGDLKLEERTAIAHIVKEFAGMDPPKDTPAYWINEYFKIFEGIDDAGLTDWDKFEQKEGEFFASAPEWFRPYIDEYFVATSDPGPEREYREAINRLNAAGYFPGKDNSIPRYQGMISGLPDEEIDRYRGIIDDWSQRPDYAFLSGKTTGAKAVIILGDYWRENGEEFDPLVVKDVGNSAKDSFQTLDYKLFKLENKADLAWLNPKLSYETLQLMAAK